MFMRGTGACSCRGILDRVDIAEVVAGVPGAWQRFFGEHAPSVDRIARASRSMGSFAASDDARRDVMARVFERIRRDDHRALRLYLDWQTRYPAKAFGDWLVIVTTNVIRDYVSERLGRADAIALELPDDTAALLVLPHATTRETARQLIEYARAILPAEQASCLAAWLEGSDFAEIAAATGLADARAAERSVRAALARLRRHAGRL